MKYDRTVPFKQKYRWRHRPNFVPRIHNHPENWSSNATAAGSTGSSRRFGSQKLMLAQLGVLWYSDASKEDAYEEDPSRVETVEIVLSLRPRVIFEVDVCLALLFLSLQDRWGKS